MCVCQGEHWYILCLSSQHSWEAGRAGAIVHISEKGTGEVRSTSYHPGWEVEFTGGGISKLPSARRDSQPACVWKPIFARNGLVSPDRDRQMC